MNRFPLTRLALALCAAAGLSTAALAADSSSATKAPTNNADKTQVAPSAEDLPKTPSVDAMDANAQRQHDNDRDNNTSPPNTKSGAGNMAASTADGATRDWNAIDANNDNLIEPKEMEQALKAPGPQAKKQKQAKE